MKKACLLCIFAILFMISISYADSERVAILPMKINAAQDYSFLQNGIMDMLSTRLAWKDRLDVVGNRKRCKRLKNTARSWIKSGRRQ